MTKKLLAVLLAVAICFSLCIPVFASTRQLVSKYHSQTLSNPMWRESAPYPDGEFVEVYNSDTGRILLYNFASNDAYKISALDVTGIPLSSFTPYTWGNTSGNVHSGTVYIQSTKPIYRASGTGVLSDWILQTSDSTLHQDIAWSINSAGEFVQSGSRCNWSLYTTTFTGSDSVVVTASTPMCWLKSVGLYPSYNANSSFVIAPFYNGEALSTINNSSNLLEIADLLSEFNSWFYSINAKLSSNDKSISQIAWLFYQDFIEKSDRLWNTVNSMNVRVTQIKQGLDLFREEFSNYYSYFTNDYINSLDNWFYNVETRLDTLISEIQKITTNSGDSGGKKIDEGKSSAQQKAKDETPDPADEIDVSSFSLNGLVSGFNWVKAQLNNFFSITHVDTFIEVVLFIALAGWVIGKKLNKG